MKRTSTVRSTRAQSHNMSVMRRSAHNSCYASEVPASEPGECWRMHWWYRKNQPERTQCPICWRQL